LWDGNAIGSHIRIRINLHGQSSIKISKFMKIKNSFKSIHKIVKFNLNMIHGQLLMVIGGNGEFGLVNLLV
jgi:ABC-type uncharacterized transport system ATPase subunit